MVTNLQILQVQSLKVSICYYIADKALAHLILHLHVMVVHVEGNGSDSEVGNVFVSSGKAFVTTSLASGYYNITVQDLDAGITNFYSEYEDFFVKGGLIHSVIISVHPRI